MPALVPLIATLAMAQPAPGPARWVAGTPALEEGIRFVRIAPVDGDAREETRAGKACLRTDDASGNRYVYFDVSRQWLKTFGHDPYRAEATVEYLDSGRDLIALQFDGEGRDVASNYREVSWRCGNTGAWCTRTVVLERAEFRNGQQGRADLRIAAYAGTTACVASISLRILAASAAPAARQPYPLPEPPARREQRVWFDNVRVLPIGGLDGPGRVALGRLRERLDEIGARQAPMSRGRGSDSGRCVTLVVGRWDPVLGRRYPRAAALMRRLAADPVRFHRRDGYAVVAEHIRRATVVCAVGLETPGAVYAIGAVHQRALRDDGGVSLLLDRTPRLETPAFDRRELYLNIGYGLARPRITVEDWEIADWKRFIDRLVLARYNAWSFYLWGDCAVLHPAAIRSRELNLRIHTALRRAIDYGHRRGLQVGLQFTPTLLPVEIWESHPELRAKLEYAYPGTMCPSHPETWRWMREVVARQIDWFRACDFFSLWYYDVGGCFCDICRTPQRQLRVLLDQAKAFAPMARSANPRATFQVMAWAIWRYERMHRYSIRQEFVDELRRWFAAQRMPLLIADGICADPGTQPLFDLIRRAGVPATAFLYQTNIESGQPLPVLLTRYLAQWVPAALHAGATHAFLMRMEAGTKQADDIVAGRYLWQPAVRRDDALLDCARLVTGDARAARRAWQALERMDDFAWFGKAGGGADAARGGQIETLAAEAAAASPRAIRPRLEWLVTAGKAYRILGMAVDARDEEDDAALEQLDDQFRAAMAASPLYRHQAEGAPYWRALFRTALVRYFHSGWSMYPF